MLLDDKTKTLKLLNLTGHPVVYRSSSGDLILPPTISSTRVEEYSLRSEVYQTTDLKGRPVLVAVNVVQNELQELPEPREGVLLVVPTPVAMLASRPDVIAPDTYRAAVRDGERKVIAVTRFRTFQKR